MGDDGFEGGADGLEDGGGGVDPLCDVADEAGETPPRPPGGASHSVGEMSPRLASEPTGVIMPGEPARATGVWRPWSESSTPDDSWETLLAADASIISASEL